ncbi:MAG: zf-HC2 domain-containing protein [Gemmatimonadaceae bacterium]
MREIPNCALRDYWSPLVSDYIDDELSVSDSLGVACHLWECAECRRLLRDLLMIVDAVQELRQMAANYAPVVLGDQISFGPQSVRLGKLVTPWEC